MATTAVLSMDPVPIDELRPDAFNPRRISDAELEALTRSLREFGFVQPVVVRAADKLVIGGHQRLLAARRLGYSQVPVIALDVSLEQARLLNLALNKIAGDWDSHENGGTPRITLALALTLALSQRERGRSPTRHGHFHRLRMAEAKWVLAMTRWPQKEGQPMSFPISGGHPPPVPSQCR